MDTTQQMHTPLRERFIQMLRDRPSGVKQSQELLMTLGTTSEELMAIINPLLQEAVIEMMQDDKDGALIYVLADPQQMAKYSGLDPHHKHVLQLVEKAGNMGIWTRDIKLRTNLQNNTLTKILKSLEGKNLVKSVNSFQGKNKKLYMLFGLTPSRELTGGPWYTNGEFDYEFVHGEKGISEFIRAEIDRCGEVSIAELTQTVSDFEGFQVALGEQEVRSVVNALVYDGYAEAVNRVSKGGHEQKVYRSLRKPTAEASMNLWTSTPCGVCPVFDQCSPGGIVSPERCEYLDAWLLQGQTSAPDHGMLPNAAADAGGTLSADALAPAALGGGAAAVGVAYTS